MADNKVHTSSSSSLGYEPKSYNFLNQFKSSGVSIPAFTGDSVHYDSWKTRMEVVLASMDLSDFVNIKDEMEVKKLSDFVLLDRRLHDLIVLCVTDSVLATLKACGKSGWQMWRHLDVEHNRQDVASKYAVMSQLLAYRYKGKGIKAHCDDVIALIYSLASKGTTFDSDFMVCILLHSLPAEYSTFVTTISAQIGVELTVDIVRTRAIAEEMRLRRNGSDHVLLSQSRHMNQNVKARKRKGAFVEKRKCFKCKKPGHLAKDCPEADFEMAALAIEDVALPALKRQKLPVGDLKMTDAFEEPVKDSQVAVVTSAISITDEKPELKLPEKRKPELKVQTENLGISKPQAPKVASLKTAAGVRQKPAGTTVKKVVKRVIKAPAKVNDTKPEVALKAGGAETSVVLADKTEINEIVEVYSFVVDSGATSHMVWNQDILESFEKRTSAINQAEKGRCIEAVGTGALFAVFHSKGKVGRITLRDVLVVPSLSINIISVAKLSANNLRVVFEKDQCDIFNQSGRLIAKAIKQRGMFILNLKIKKPSESVLVTDENKSNSKLDLWHRRLGHLHAGMIRQMLQSEKFEKSKLECMSCIQGKLARAPFGRSESKTLGLFELVHTDVCGPFDVATMTGHRYFVTFIDDMSRFCFIYLIKLKSEVFGKFKEFSAMISNVHGERVKILRSDNGGEYNSLEFKEYMRIKGIQHQTTVAYTPQQNGVAERMNRTILDAVRSMLVGAGLNRQYWGYAVLCATYIRNRCWNAHLKKKSPYEMMHKRKPKLLGLKVFGCICFAQVPDEKRNKLDARAVRCLFLGYSTTSKAYIVQELGNMRIYTSRDVKFFEEKFLVKEDTSNNKETFQARPEVYPLISVENINTTDDSLGESRNVDQQVVPVVESSNFEVENQVSSSADESMVSRGDINNDVEHQSVLENEEALNESEESDDDFFDPQPFGERDYMGSRYIMQEADIPPRLALNAPPMHAKRRSHYRDSVNETVLVLVPGPNTYRQVLKSQHSKEWLKAMEEEMESLHKNKTWILVKRPERSNIIGCRWILGIKRGADGVPERYKARLCAQGFTQEFGVDYVETFSPVAHYNSIRLFLAVAVWMKMDVQQMDVKTAFLNGTLDEELYMKQPPGFEVKGKEDLVCKLEKSLYGLKQSPRQWNITMNEFLNKIGFKNSSADSCIYVKRVKDKMVIIALYVDDLMIGSDCNELMQKTKEALNKRFEMKDLGKLKFCLGIEIVWNDDGSCNLRQRQYLLDVLERFNMNDCKPVSTPLQSGIKLSKSMCATSKKDRDDMADVPYRSAVGSLIYLVTGTRPDIAVAVGEVSKYLENPGRLHWAAVKRILRYLKGTIEMSLQCKPESMNLVGYCDADWAGDIDTRRSTTGYIFKFGGTPVCWKSKRQPTVALSTAEAEYMSMAHAAQTSVWLRRLLSDLGFVQESPVKIYEDNQGCIAMAKNPVNHERTKHIDIKYHFVRELVTRGVIEISYLETEEMLADILTKGMTRDRHDKLCRAIGLQNLSVEGEC